jgi:energy-coupling factor transport system ATP-binding protein
MTLVRIEAVTYRYPGRELPALGGIDLTFEPGEFVVLAGASGSGKSTLLRAISGLVPHFHGGEFAGSVEVAARNTRLHGPGDLASDVGVLFQDPETQIVMGTVRAELAFGVENRGWSAASVSRAVEETALALAIDGLLDRSTAELSGGELQRVALGATLAGNPKLVTLDEPTSQLDPVAGDELIGLLRRLNDDAELTVILAEHRLERCLPYADRVIAMESGRVAFDGSPTDFLIWAVASQPALAAPGAQLLTQLRLPPAVGVRAARQALRRAGLELPAADVAFQQSAPSQLEGSARPSAHRWVFARPRSGRAEPALELKGVWHEIREGPAILRGLSVSVAPGERVAVMGRNGAGKSTMLKHAAGLMKPTRGSVRAAGRVSLVLQNPNDYLVHDTVAEETSAGALSRFGLTALAERHPRDLSGGERQRLALAIVMGHPLHDPTATVVCMDEPTRGMDRGVKGELAELLKGLSAAVIVATHDPEFAAAFADRVLLLADGAVIADGPAAEILSGGTYFATETARILRGAGGALLPAQGAALIARQVPSFSIYPSPATADGERARGSSRPAPQPAERAPGPGAAR